MKNTYQILYGMSVLLILTVLLGGSITKPVFNNFSVKTLDAAGVKKASFDSLDSRVDEMLYTVSKIQLQIDRLKNLFSDKEIDESKYQKQKNEVFTKNIYEPITELLIITYRVLFLFLSVILFLSAVILQLIYHSRDLRRRVSALESKFELNGA